MLTSIIGYYYVKNESKLITLNVLEVHTYVHRKSFTEQTLHYSVFNNGIKLISQKQFCCLRCSERERGHLTSYTPIRNLACGILPCDLPYTPTLHSDELAERKLLQIQPTIIISSMHNLCPRFGPCCVGIRSNCRPLPNI